MGRRWEKGSVSPESESDVVVHLRTKHSITHLHITCRNPIYTVFPDDSEHENVYKEVNFIIFN